jgi:hypothetical protein
MVTIPGEEFAITEHIDHLRQVHAAWWHRLPRRLVQWIVIQNCTRYLLEKETRTQN